MELLRVIGRVIVVYIILIISLRVLGKREVGELSIFDLVIILIIADIASIGIDNPDFRKESYICVVTLVVIQRIISFISLKYAKIRSVIDGESKIIVTDGVLHINNMKKERYSIDDLISQMRLEHIMDINEIKLGILEPNGTLSIFRNSQFDKISLPLIVSGNIVKETMIVFDINEEIINLWMKRLEYDIKKIIYCSICKEGLILYGSSKNKEVLKPHKIVWKELE